MKQLQRERSPVREPARRQRERYLSFGAVLLVIGPQWGQDLWGGGMESITDQATLPLSCLSGIAFPNTFFAWDVDDDDATVDAGFCRNGYRLGHREAGGAGRCGNPVVFPV